MQQEVYSTGQLGYPQQTLLRLWNPGPGFVPFREFCGGQLCPVEEKL